MNRCPWVEVHWNFWGGIAPTRMYFPLRTSPTPIPTQNKEKRCSYTEPWLGGAKLCIAAGTCPGECQLRQSSLIQIVITRTVATHSDSCHSLRQSSITQTVVTHSDSRQSLRQLSLTQTVVTHSDSRHSLVSFSGNNCYYWLQWRVIHIDSLYSASQKTLHNTIHWLQHSRGTLVQIVTHVCNIYCIVGRSLASTRIRTLSLAQAMYRWRHFMVDILPSPPWRTVVFRCFSIPFLSSYRTSCRQQIMDGSARERFALMCLHQCTL